MNKETKKMIPELRFPEFWNEGEWEEIKLKQLGSFFRGLTYGADDTDSKGLLVLRSGNIQNDSLIFDKDLVFVKKDCPEELRLLSGDIVICMSNGSKVLVGKNAEYKGEYKKHLTVGAFCSIMRPQNKFTKYLLQTDKYQSFIAISIGGGNINNLKNSDLEGYECPAPKNPLEQQKIASCISTLDEVIAAHSQKLETLKEHKKGLMQNLFPQEGETVPKYRFPEFVADGEWVEKPLGSFSELIKEKANTKKHKLLSVTAGIGFVSQIEKFGKEIAGDSYKNYFVIRKGDFAYNKSSVKIHPEGQIALLEKDDYGAVPNSIFTCFRVDKKIIYPYFLKYPFENNIHGNWLRKFIAIGARANGALNVDNKDLLALPVSFPSLPEQQKIASCLSALDDLIAAQAEKAEQLKLHKKGLMQGLFPKINK